ncbi:MAG: hypothetical protein HY898_05640 [Deltaproteobacteria bacterium]|nr:hypothetical protein [Deltaproteobacteria bacterium]
MASDLGSVFSTHALAALTRARAQFELDRWTPGIEAVSEQALRAALNQAVAATARAASVGSAKVLALVPQQEVDAVLAELGPKQKLAHETTRRYGSSFNSFLARSLHVEDSTAGAYLRGLASRHYDDDFISGPLGSFADELTRWQDLMERCISAVRADRALAMSFRLRKLVRVVVSVGAGFVVSAVIAATAWWWLVAVASRKRLDAALANPDPCADASIPAADRRHARPPQLAALQARVDQCAQQRRREAYVAGCTALADHVESGQLTPADDATAGASAPLLRRVAGAGLTLEDLTIDDKAFPCQDTPAGVRLWSLFARSASKAEGLWGQAEKLSPKVTSLLTQKPFALSEESQKQLANHADTITRRALVTGLPAELAHSRTLCNLQVKLGAEPLGRGCKALFRLDAGK